MAIANLLNSKNSDEAKKILCRKADVPGFQQPTYVINYDECIDLIDFLPKQRVKHVRDFINKQFKRVRAGDQTLHAEVDARAGDSGLEATMARESLGLPAVTNNEDRALKRRRDELELMDMETKILKTQCDFMTQLSGGELEARDRLFYMDRMRNVNIHVKLITNGTVEERYVITISAECQKLGYTTFKNKDWQVIGIFASRRYKERAIANGETDRKKQRPPKHVQEAAGGNTRPVCTYMAPDDLPIIHAAIEEYARKKQQQQQVMGVDEEEEIFDDDE